MLRNLFVKIDKCGKKSAPRRVSTKVKAGFVISITSFFIILLLFAGAAYATNGGVDIGCAVKLSGKCISEAFPTLGSFFTAIVRLALFAAALIFFAMVVWGGFRYLNAGGDKENVEGARKTLTGAGIGLVIVVASLLVTQIALPKGRSGGGQPTPSGQPPPPHVRMTAPISNTQFCINTNVYKGNGFRTECIDKDQRLIVTFPGISTVDAYRNTKTEAENFLRGRKLPDLCKVGILWTPPKKLLSQLTKSDWQTSGCSFD